MDLGFSRNSSSSSSTVASDRLQKAIERNRKKQLKRQATGASRLPSSSPSSSIATRRGVATADNTEFTTSLRSARKAPASVSYSSSSSTPSVIKRSTTTTARARSTSTRSRATTKRISTKRKASLEKWQEYLIKGAWVFCGFLLLRLVFSQGGVVDFYDKKSFLNKKFYELKSVKNDNQKLMAEIEKIKSSSRYQKKLVRDHLGFIASDEYLVLFAKGKSSKAN